MMQIKFAGNDLADNGLILIKTDGLGASDGEISISEYASISGGIVAKSRIPSREITLTYAIVGSDPEEARITARQTYPMLKRGTLEIITPYKDVVTTAYVKRVECDLWQQSQQIDITLVCPDPYLYSTVSKTVPAETNQWSVVNEGEQVGCICQVSRTGYVRIAGSEDRLRWDASSVVTDPNAVLTLDMREGKRDLYYMDGTNKVSLLDYILEWNWFLLPHTPDGHLVLVRSNAVNGTLTFTERWLGI